MIGLKSNFIQRGYRENILQKQLIKAESTDRKELLKEREKNISQRVRFTMTFNENLPGMNSILNKHWHLLQTNSQNSVVFHGKPRLTFRRNKNLKDLIRHTHLTHNNKNTTAMNKKNWIKQRLSQPCK